MLAAACGAAATAQAITDVRNAASNISQGLPNSGIAQGAIFSVFGTTLGPSPAVTATQAFQSTSLGGSSVSVTVGSTTVNALMYYVSATQINALLPSSTPTGSGTIIVTYNGTQSPSQPIQVVSNNLGIFTITSSGAGIGIVTYPDYSLVSSVPGTGSQADTCTGGGACPDTYTGAAMPGDVLTIWATGLGPISGNDASGSGLGVNMPSIPLTVWLGGVSATATYQGRSGCCIGEDQIVFTVPSNVPTGCAVPLEVQIGTLISNSVVIPVGSGSRSCIPQSPVLAASAQIFNTNTTINTGSFELDRQISSEGSGGIAYEDVSSGSLSEISPTAQFQPIFLSSLDSAPLGTCSTLQVVNGIVQSPPPLYTIVTGLDAGAVTITGPSGQVAMREQPGTGIPTSYTALLSPLGVYLSGGSYTVTAGGGKTVGSFKIPFTVTATPAWPSADQAALVTGAGVSRANGMTITWTGGSSAYYLELDVSSSVLAADSENTLTGVVQCLVPSTLGTFHIPANVLLALPSGSAGQVDFKPSLNPVTFSASGLDVGSLTLQYDTAFWPLTLN